VDGKRIGIYGSAGLLQKEIFTSRAIGNSSFALVKTGEFEGVPIYNQNSVVAYSNRSGIAAFPIRPYERSKIEIKEEDLPLDLETKVVELNPAAYARSGVFVNFPLKYSKNLLIHVKQKNGSNVPTGAYARLTTNEEQYIVAKDGEVYLTNLSEKNRVVVTWLENKCEFDLLVDMKKTDQEIIEPFICVQ
jgi:outer membrane usher protein